MGENYVTYRNNVITIDSHENFSEYIIVYSHSFLHLSQYTNYYEY